MYIYATYASRSTRLRDVPNAHHHHVALYDATYFQGGGDVRMPKRIIIHASSRDRAGFLESAAFSARKRVSRTFSARQDVRKRPLEDSAGMLTRAEAYKEVHD